MNNFQAMVSAMVVLNEDGILAPGSYAYQIARKMIACKIDRLGPEAAVMQIIGNKAHLLSQIRMVCS
ncbi:uncharacterized protein Dvar_47500 [Desulfosarcina variabilis str. Montpellier]|uniref:hypothetical protein n=1 Tax=Desulfosarcina variabilis TaxID=2300 RepID=UPI003AFA7FA4